MSAPDQPVLPAPSAELGRITQSTVRDTPAADDALGFKPYVQAIAAFLDAPATQPPFTLSLEGEWGSGKSSFMKQLQDALDRGPDNTPSPSVTIAFNAWRFDKQDALWAAFALAVTRELRHRSSWPLRIRGAFRLFVARIDGPAAWLRLLQFLALWALVLAASVFLLVYLAQHPVHQAQALRALFPVKTTEGEIPAFYARLLSSGAWAGAVGILAAILGKSGSWLKSHLFDIQLEKLITQPDYASHAAFIEDFHRDFAATIRAYAGTRKVYVFVDDLDRCDLLKAAELMQAINLMIGEDPHLVFILGIDRDKIAAGIAAKYVDVLPFLINKGDPATITAEDRLAFGYQYLEKFIQLSFRIPVPDEQSVLRHFVERLSPEASTAAPKPSRWQRFLAALHVPRDARQDAVQGEPTQSAQPERATKRSFPPATTDSQATPRTPTRTFIRVETGGDSQRIVEAVLMVRHLFGNNPRRLKQFLNSYRLSLYLASSQGLLDVIDDRSPLTLEQLGKIVAFLMRFPQLSRALLEDSKFFAKCELFFSAPVSVRKFDDEDLSPPPPWFDTFEVRDLFRFGLDRGDRQLYSLRWVDTGSILGIMPAVPRPSDTTLQILQNLKIPVPPSSEIDMENFLRADGFAFSEIRINGRLVATVDAGGRSIPPQRPQTDPQSRPDASPPSSVATPSVTSSAPASTPSSAPDRPDDDLPRPAPRPGPFSLILTDPGAAPRETIRALRRITDLSLDEAGQLVQNTPAPLFRNVSLAFATDVGRHLDGLATVQIVGSDNIPGSSASSGTLSSSGPDRSDPETSDSPASKPTSAPPKTYAESAPPPASEYIA